MMTIILFQPIRESVAIMIALLLSGSKHHRTLVKLSVHGERDEGPGTYWDLRVYSGAGSTPGALRLFVGQAGFAGNAVLWDNQWHHVVAVFANDGSPNVRDVLFYVDGQLDAQFGGQPAPSFSKSKMINTDTVTQPNLYIGSSPNKSFSFNGQIDEFCMFKRALSAKEINNLYRMGSP